jgi:hypothetical protein
MNCFIKDLDIQGKELCRISNYMSTMCQILKAIAFTSASHVYMQKYKIELPTKLNSPALPAVMTIPSAPEQQQ